MLAILRVIRGPYAGQEVRMTASRLLVGRDMDCHLRPNTRFISRRHCLLWFDEGRLWIRDAGSRNGTFVNGNILSGHCPLEDGDTFSVGDMLIQIDRSGWDVEVPVVVDDLVLANGQLGSTETYPTDEVSSGPDAQADDLSSQAFPTISPAVPR